MAREEETRRIPRKIGEYEILEEVGRGGMGTVYRAREPRLGRVVALKVLHSSPGMGAAALRELDVRFEREASQTARLAHPNIIPVFDYGEADGFRFFTMPFIDGGSLAQLVARRGPLPAPEAFRTLLPLASALAHAHREGVVHRDVKPSNILLDKEGNPMLVDFGLVKGRADATELTTAGTILGTPQFMSPEQASGDSNVVDERSDVYSLGAVLFFLLTGHSPFEGDSTVDVFARIANQPVPDPVQFAPGLDRQARMVCLKALAKRKADRYAGAAELAKDLERYLSGKKVKARPRGWRETRSPLSAGIGAALLLVASLGLVRWLDTSRVDRPRLVLGVAPFESEERIAGAFGPFARYLGRAIGGTVEYRIGASYEDLVHRVTERRVDLAVLPATSYVEASRTGKVEPLATFSAWGETHYRGVIVVRRSSGIRKLADLAGRPFGYVDRFSSSGYIYANALLLERGFDPERFLGPRQFFGSHDRVREAVLASEVDAGATNLVDIPIELRVLDQTEPIPFDAFVAHVETPHRERIQEALLALDATDRVGKALSGLYRGFGGWREARDSDYDSVRRLVWLKSEPVRIACLPAAGGEEEAAEDAARRFAGDPRSTLVAREELARRLPAGTALDPPPTGALARILTAGRLDFLVLASRDSLVLWRRLGDRAERFGAYADADAALDAIPVYGFVEEALGEGQVAVNLGSGDGLSPGRELAVFHYELRRDEVRGAVRELVEVTQGRVRVLSVEERRSICQVVEGGEAVAYGKRVRTLPR